jgi:hypothetical protein
VVWRNNAWVNTLPGLLWAGGGGAVYVIFLAKGVIEASAHHAEDGYGMKVPMCFFQR